MKKILQVILMLTIVTNACLAQGSDDNKGIFKNFKIKSGFTVSYSRQFTEDWVYILKADSKFTLRKEHKDDGVPLSLVILIPCGKDEVFNILFNLSLVDIANSKSFFNSRIPFGIGGSVFPKNWPVGFALFCNIGQSYRMRQESYDDPSVVFPIANYKGYNLAVGSPLPEEVIKPFCYAKTTYSLNGGIIFRFN